MSNTLRVGQALSSLPLRSGSLVPNGTLIGTSNDPRSVRVQAVWWNGQATALSGSLLTLKDGAGVQFYSGRPTTLTAIHATLPFITLTTPITYTIKGVPNAGKMVIIYGEVI